MRVSWLYAAGALWMMLLILSLEPRLLGIIRQSPEILSSHEVRARLESGHPGLYEALARLRSAAAGGYSAMLLWHAGPEQQQYIFYRASYELFPLRVWFVPLSEPPVANDEVSLILGNAGGIGEMGSRAFFAAIGSHRDSDRAAIYRRTDLGRDKITFRRLEPQPSPVPATGASRPWLWPVGVGTIVALGMFFAWATGMNCLFAGERPAWLAFSFLSGAGLIGFVMMALSLAGARQGLFLLLATLVALGGVVWIWLRAGEKGENRERFVPLPTSARGHASFWVDQIGFGLILLGVLVAVLRALIPFEAWHNWDAWAIWDFKVKACFTERGIPMEYLRHELYGFSHRDYPLGYPLLQTYLAFWSGGIEHALLRLISPCFYAVLLLMTADLLRGLGIMRGRWFLAGLLGLVPFVLDQSANGYADLPLSAAMTACLAMAVRTLRGQAPLWAVAWSGAIAASIKDEGLIWAAACLAVAFWGTRRRIHLRQAALATLLLLALAGPWKTVTARLGLSSADRAFDMPVIAREAGSRATLMVRAVMLETVGAGMAGGQLWGRPGGGFRELKVHVLGKWLLLWQAAIIALLLGMRKLRGGVQRHVIAVLAIQATAVTAAYLATSHDLAWHLMTSLDRIMLQVAPAFLALAVSCLAPVREAASDS